jgi:hypothetical protein
MAQERKAGESGPPAPKMRSVVPVAKKDDIEDVAWALQTAEAIWSRGDHADALKWIRRAAEAASEAEADDRALELAKAAADVASLLADRPTAVAPPPVHAPTPTPTPAITPTAPVAPRIMTTSAAPPALQPPAAGRPPSGGPIPPRVGTNAPPLPRPGQKAITPSRVQAPAPVSKRGARRSSPSFADALEVTATGDGGRPRRASTTNETSKRSARGRASKPAADETAPVTTRHPSTEEAEAWPTQSLTGDEVEDESQFTRIGTTAYREGAQRASARPAAMGPPLAPLVMSQAVRVVVWRGADGVHVAPAGTQVTAIGVEAILVALDPVADLAAWLSNK